MGCTCFFVMTIGLHTRGVVLKTMPSDFITVACMGLITKIINTIHADPLYIAAAIPAMLIYIFLYILYIIECIIFCTF